MESTTLEDILSECGVTPQTRSLLITDGWTIEFSLRGFRWNGIKMPKLELASLHTLLVDDPPSMDISNGNMGINGVRNLLAVHDVAVAMCGGAHLANLKAYYSHKFVGFLTQRVDPETMLRCASITESQAADHQNWNTLSDLMTDRGWSMDDSLHEMTHVRHDLPGLLQLRPRPPKAIPWQPPPGVFSEKGKGKFGKGGTKSKGGDKGKGKGKVQWLTDIKTKDGSWKQLCMRGSVHWGPNVSSSTHALHVEWIMVRFSISKRLTDSVMGWFLNMANLWWQRPPIMMRHLFQQVTMLGAQCKMFRPWI